MARTTKELEWRACPKGAKLPTRPKWTEWPKLLQCPEVPKWPN